MRRAFLPILSLALLLLVAGTWLTWQRRFEIDPAYPPLTLHDLKDGLALEPGVTWEADPSGAPELVLDVGKTSRPVVQLLPLPLSGSVGFLMFDFGVQAQWLKPGGKPWSDGRLTIEWHTAKGAMAPEYLVSARGNDSAEVPCVVAGSDHGLAVPVLRVEQLGSAGVFRLKHCRIDAVRETAWWTTGRWLLLGAWFIWAASFAAWGRTSGLGRALLAAAAWVFCISQWAVPGPWQLIHPLAPRFEIREPATRASLAISPALPQKSAESSSQPTPAPAPATPAPATPAPATPAPATPAPATPAPATPAPATPAPATPVQSLGELPFGGSVLLEIKDRIKEARPLFHMLLFLGPALVLVFLIGRWKSVVLAALLAGAIEWSQYLFGYGFDSSDLFDLSCDALGVALALWLHARLSRWWLARKKASEPVADETSASQPT